MHTKIPYKVLSTSVGVLLAVSGLAGCGSQSQTSPNTSATLGKGAVTISFWNEMTGPYEVALSGEISNFEKLHPNIKIDDVVVSNDAALEPKLLAAMVGQDLPTLSQMNPPWATGMIQTGSLVNLSPLISGPNGFSTSSFYPNMLKPGRWPSGGQYLLPFNLGAAIIYYNEKQFQEAGITTPPKTWSDFTSDATKLSTNGRHAFAITLVHSYPWLAFFDEAGGDFVGPNGEPNQAAFAANGPAVQALTLWSNLVKDGSATLTQGYASQTDFANGTSSILIGTTGFYPYLEQAVAGKFPIAEAPLPSDTTSATSLYGGYIGMFSNASPAQQQAAFMFMKYLTSKEGQTYWMEKSQGYLPVRNDVAQSAESFLKSHPAQAVSLSVLNSAIPYPKVAWWDEFSHQVLLNAITAVLINKETPVEAMQSAYQAAVSLAQKDGTYQ